ncbi:MAG: DNA mismatch repair endonuclease MutL [Desulfobacteraceae bacterium]|nr:DNA mismatch repair endonuclease MutL [Desulfobacteraceae bacterium]
MPRIRILPDILANKIAAGEVVERPASVVKELVENALDAGGSRIVIDIENGGRSLIQVADNGIGMSRDDALLALERFATSKLHTDADLGAIQTLGFRGEALPSIAAVAKLTLITREQGSDTGVEVQVEGGKITQVIDTGAAQGTLIRVAQLFFNTPARRKFLKSTGTEMGHVADTVAGMALAYPQVHFKLNHNGKVVKQWPRVSDPIERAADVMAQLGPNDLIKLEARAGDIFLTGVVAKAGITRSTTGGIYLFVNGRRVRDRVMQHALFEGFHGRLMKGQFPLAALFLQLPFDQVDVNVHPTKHEVRFVDQRGVHSLVQQGVAEALGRAERRMWKPFDSGQTERVAAVSEPAGDYAAPTKPSWDPVPPMPPSAPASAALAAPSKPQGVEPIPKSWPRPKPSLSSKPTQEDFWTAQGFADLTVIGQFRGTYIICQDRDDLVLIDQHAAHERIVYEQLAAKDQRVQAQQLLLPETVELGFAEAQMAEQLIAGLSAMGLEIEPFGGTTFVIKSVPILLSDQDVGRIVRELVERSVEIGLGAGLDKILDECRMVMACHHAVRANQRLTDTEIQTLLTQLDRCQNPGHCPHGRPVFVRWTQREIEKAFGRSG